MLRLTASDGALTGSDTLTVTVNASGGGGLPPDPGTVAPDLDPTVATTTYDATAFLYTGANPIQTGVAPGTIEPARAAVIRGRVLDRANRPLPGVTVTILGHPEFGQTLSRADGAFDLAVNGGGLLTLNLRKDGYLLAQRQLDVPWQEYAIGDDLVLIARDTQATGIDLGQASAQVARGSAVTDGDGTRQATLLIPSGTSAQVYNADGSTRAVDSLTLRATEYTIGENGPAAMPGPLPANVGYTYAIELSADEAGIKRNGKDVLFNQPVPFYVENFLNFPVGETVPVGYYDADRAAWVPSDSGRVIKILAIAGGLAALDLDGNGTADDSAALAALGIDDAERQRLAALYPAGQTLWRVRLTHLSTWDCNWPFGPPDDAVAPPPSPPPPPPDPDPCISCPCPGAENTAAGSVIGCESRTLGETLPLAGTGLTLNYRSNRQPGYKRNALKIALSGATVPASLKRIVASVEIAGRRIDLGTFPAQANQGTDFVWDGQDAYGNTPRGAQTARVMVGYVYDGVYQRTSRFGGNGTPITGNRTRQEVTLWRNSSASLGAPAPASAGPVGGWSLTAHHAYDPTSKTLYLGDGNRRMMAANVNGGIIETVAGGGSSGDGSLATAARLYDPTDVILAPDGSLYIADDDNHRVRRVDPDGIITTVAGTGTAGFSGDGGLATAAKFSSPHTLALTPDGSLYIADSDNNRIRRVGPDGIVTTVVGGGQDYGDGGLATAARLYNPISFALTPDGSLYIAEWESHRVRRVGPDGIITTVAGTGNAGFSGDGGLATAARLNNPHDVALAPDGNLYIADYNNTRIRRVRPDGIIETVAGGSSSDTRISSYGTALASDGTLYIADSGNHRIRRLEPNGTITTVAGTGSAGFSGDGGLATAAKFSSPHTPALASNGSFYITDRNNDRIRRVGPPLPGFAGDDIAVANGQQLYRFDANGRHLSTVDTLTGATLYTFDYDAEGRLIRITDANRQVVSVERNAAGNPTAIVAPFGQRTALTVDANGWLASVADPAGATYRMTYGANGLLATFADPNSHTARLTYDADGRLSSDTNAAGSAQTLAHAATDDGYTVTRNTGEGRVTAYAVERLTTGDQERNVTAPDGTIARTEIKTDGRAIATAPDGTVVTTIQGPDPRFGMQVPVTTSTTLASGGKTATLATAVAATLTDSNDPLSLTKLTTTTTTNGRAATSVYDRATRTTTLTSAAGRRSYGILDEQSRLIEAGVTGIAPIRLAYDGQGRLTSLTQGTGAAARVASFGYNAAGELEAATDALGHTGTLDYDLAGRVTAQTLANGERITFGYDAKGNLTSLAPPGRPAHEFTYDAVDLMAGYLPPAVAGGGDTDYAYNRDQQLTQVTRPDGGILRHCIETNCRQKSN